MGSATCPVCEGILPDGGWPCGCGFNPATPKQEAAIERLLVRRRKTGRLLAGAGLFGGLFVVTVSLWISGGMSAYGVLPLLFNGVMAAFVGVMARRERTIVNDQLAAARSIGQLPPARVVE